MGLFPVDKGDQFIEEGRTLITETDSDKYLNANRKQKKKDEIYDLPEDRLSRPCGGAGGFDDFVERWHQWINNSSLLLCLNANLSDVQRSERYF